MSFAMLLTCIFAPALFWIGYFYYHDRLKPEPILLTALSYILGFFSAWLCLRAYGFLVPFFGLPVDIESLAGLNLPFLLYCILGVGLVEELFKFLPFGLMTAFSDFDEEIDGIFYASAVALGFASYENIHYLPDLSGFALYGRALASPLSHTIFASIWGLMVGRRVIRRQRIWPILPVGIALSALAHGLFDFLTLSTALLRLAAALMLLALWLWRIRASERLMKRGAEHYPPSG